MIQIFFIKVCFDQPGIRGLEACGRGRLRGFPAFGDYAFDIPSVSVLLAGWPNRQALWPIGGMRPRNSTPAFTEERPIAVIPFTNLSREPELECFDTSAWSMWVAMQRFSFSRRLWGRTISSAAALPEGQRAPSAAPRILTDWCQGSVNWGQDRRSGGPSPQFPVPAGIFRSAESNDK